jgi:hypothetical protein
MVTVLRGTRQAGGLLRAINCLRARSPDGRSPGSPNCRSRLHPARTFATATALRAGSVRRAPRYDRCRRRRSGGGSRIRRRGAGPASATTSPKPSCSIKAPVRPMLAPNSDSIPPTPPSSTSSSTAIGGVRRKPGSRPTVPRAAGALVRGELVRWARSRGPADQFTRDDALTIKTEGCPARVTADEQFPEPYLPPRRDEAGNLICCPVQCHNPYGKSSC